MLRLHVGFHGGTTVYRQASSSQSVSLGKTFEATAEDMKATEDTPNNNYYKDRRKDGLVGAKVYFGLKEIWQKHGETNYYLTQMLIGHGSFQAYTYSIAKW